VAERRNRTLIEMARCLLIQSGLPPSFWAEAVNTANYIRNRCPSNSLNGKTSFERWTGKAPDVKYFKEFGCNVYTLDRTPNKGKLESRSKKGIFVGYSQESKAYRIWIPDERRVDVTRDVKFLEDEEISINDDFEDFSPSDDEFTGDSRSNEIEIPLKTNEMDLDLEDEQHPSGRGGADGDNVADPPKRGRERPQIIRTGSRGRPRKHYHDAALADESANFAYLAEIPIREALQGPDAEEWLAAMESELKSIIRNETWKVVDRLEDREVIGSRIVLRNKYNSDGTLERRKARLVAKGYSQRPGVDFGDTFAPVARMSSIRMTATLAARHGMSITHFDVTTAYLNGDLEEEIFMGPPDNMEEILERIANHEKKDSKIREESIKMLEELHLGEKVLLLKKSLYGLRQAGRRWHVKLSEVLKTFGLTQSSCDPCLFYLGRGEDILIVVVYVDDILVASRTNRDVHKLLEHLSTKFNVKNLGIAKYCLGIEFSQDRGTISMTQRGYVNDLLNRFGMSESKPVGTPLDPGVKLKKKRRRNPGAQISPLSRTHWGTDVPGNMHQA